LRLWSPLRELRSIRRADGDLVVVIGASGQLGTDLVRVFEGRPVVGVDHAECDIEVPGMVATMLSRHRPSIVINTAAFHNVDRCEREPDRAFAVNATAVANLASACSEANATLVQISTDYVFDGKAREPYAETDRADPINVYGISKRAGELATLREGRHYVIRTSGLYGLRGSSVKGMTFIERMITKAQAGEEITVVDDITFSPSYTLHVAAAIRAVVERAEPGIYHATNAGFCTWYDFAAAIFDQANLEPLFRRAQSSSAPGVARRPSFSALGQSSLAAAGLAPIADWQTGIAQYLEARSAESDASIRA
jgi:dTDP-4-dehydrorhamnose reductase